MGQQLDHELGVYRRLERGSKWHPGHSAVRSSLNSFDIDGPQDKHRCLVHPPLWETVWDLLHRNPIRKLPKPVVAVVLKRLSTHPPHPPQSPRCPHSHLHNPPDLHATASTILSSLLHSNGQRNQYIIITNLPEETVTALFNDKRALTPSASDSPFLRQCRRPPDLNRPCKGPPGVFAPHHNP
ncbi:hypothetical protein BJX70DRAFT_283610 [Aspergillus crustosus]